MNPARVRGGSGATLHFGWGTRCNLMMDLSLDGIYLDMMVAIFQPSGMFLLQNKNKLAHLFPRRKLVDEVNDEDSDLH